MTFTYSSLDLSTDLAKVRRYLGDVVSTDAIFTDEEINATLAIQADLVQATASLADQAAASFARKVDVGSLSARKAASQLFDHYLRLADKYRALGPGDVPGGTGNNAGGLLIGGATQAEIDAERDDDTYTKSNFAVGMDDNHGSGANDDDDDGRYY